MLRYLRRYLSNNSYQYIFFYSFLRQCLIISGCSQNVFPVCASVYILSVSSDSYSFLDVYQNITCRVKKKVKDIDTCSIFLQTIT